MAPKIVGLTGGIGSGKTTVAKHFKALKIPVYIADIEAKALMNRSKVIKKKLIALFGEQAYKNETLNKTYIASQIFNDKSLLLKMNAIVHPKVKSHFKRWLKKQNTPYVVKEAAIIFENNLQQEYDYIITVVADKAIRIKRLLKRDQTTIKKIETIISNQLPDKEKIKQSHFVINNTNLNQLQTQVLQIHHNILKNI